MLSRFTNRRKGLYPKDAPAAAFSFSDTYDPLTFAGARQGEARIWSLLNQIAGGALAAHLDYAQARSPAIPRSFARDGA